MQRGSLSIQTKRNIRKTKANRTQNAMRNQGKNFNITDEMKQCNDALGCLMPMGITSENVAKKFGVTRREQDECAARSHQRAAIASQSKFKSEIIPVTTGFKDPKTGKTKMITVSKDDGIRPNTTVETLAKLRPAFRKGGTTTAGNASQVL